MRDAVGSTFVFGLVITFTLIFAGFLVLALNYNRAYKLKNEITSMIERYEGITTDDALTSQGSIVTINTYLKNNGYKARGECEKTTPSSKVYGVDDLSSIVYEEAQDNKKYLYCFELKKDSTNCKGYFRVTVFFDFNLPILGQLGKFHVSGQTNEMTPVYLGSTKVISCDD